MKRSKKITSMIMTAALVIGLTGCMRMDTVVDTTGSSKHYTVEITTLYNKEVIDSMDTEETTNTTTGNIAGGTSVNSDSADDIQKLPVVTLGGKKYYKEKGKKKTHSYSSKKPVDGMIVTDSSFYANSINGEKPEDVGEAIASGMIEQMNMKVIFDSKIEKTNGKRSKDKKSVTFNYKFGGKKKVNKKNPLGEMYAYTDMAENTLSSDRALMKKYNAKQKKSGKKKAGNKK